MKLALERPRRTENAASVFKESEPFVLNDRAHLIHRPRAVTLYNLHKFPHLAVKNWCGTHHTGLKKFTFLDEVPADRLLCAACEARAVMAGLPSADSLCGRHVHLGRMVPIQECCTDTKEPRK